MRKFAEIIGHKKQINLLEKDLKAENVSHAYIFTGPSNIGKTTLIRAFSKQILCDCEDSLSCKYCNIIDNGSSQDFMQSLDDGELKIEEIRDIIVKLNMSAGGKAKILFIENIERMNNNSSNAFLKILEETPKQTHILMSCSDLGHILPTIVSRSRIINLMAPDKEESLLYLQKVFPEKNAEEIIFAFEISLERVGKAHQMLKDPELFLEYKTLEESLKELFTERSIVERFLFAEKLLSNKDNAKKNVKSFYEVLTYLLRKSLFSDNLEKKQMGVKILSKISGDGILLRRNVNARLLIENLMLLIP